MIRVRGLRGASDAVVCKGAMRTIQVMEVANATEGQPMRLSVALSAGVGRHMDLKALSINTRKSRVTTTRNRV